MLTTVVGLLVLFFFCLSSSNAFQGIVVPKKGLELFSSSSLGEPELSPNGETKTPVKEYEEDQEPYLQIDIETYFDGVKPDSSWNLAAQNFVRQGKTLLEEAFEKIGLKERDLRRPPFCLGLTLSNEAVTNAEKKRIAAGESVDVHPVAQLLYDVGCLFLDKLFDERPIQRFWFLETIARIPYFSYVTCLHLYESFGWFRAVELRKVHAAEDWNELHHLLIMESLGGNSLWSDRFFGYHAAFVYYWALVITYICSPRVAYQFMELLEAHAVDTYVTFCNENRERLAQLPPPAVAKSYYTDGDLYLFDDFQVSRCPGSRRPPCDTLLDVFSNIAQDEGEHVRTMKACQDYAAFGTKVVSPHLSCNCKDPLKQSDDKEWEATRRQQWKEWSKEINNIDDDTDQYPNEMDP
mmetsp:Transcript_5034/g.7274  ORF Transcript_5034/g.7274 Transcript_5034/m.7274 type:complete len:408 (-) Transcript_5034:122-1345(-)|eukprot:CAMPEP_0194204532 /NCGR_PEP_ID=MMETSP0156-20130528/4028_1 /TAXON_ID=33649 /ORGANISM="Thalassionema nitzschioides, Strain L26-B" /LENGTH=407 /DNA_ID=CAMNT_0038930571 /DNA_START=34 /DNA_END=1257 /DNA_ORIENTATION=+